MNADNYLVRLAQECHTPHGFRFARDSFDFYPVERPTSLLTMNISLIQLSHPTAAWAACCSQNLLVSDTIRLIRSLPPGAQVQTLLINNRISNVGLTHGRHDIEELQSRYAAVSGVTPRAIVPISTGIIGWRLPLEEMKVRLPHVYEELGAHNPAHIASAIMTTDRYPKARSVAVGGGHILGIVKGAGMIEPHMATMLAFLMTDLDIDASTLQGVLQEVVNESFNSTTVDGDQSTSDIAMLISSRQRTASVGVRQFQDALSQLSVALAQDIVRNGEGVGHVVALRIVGAPSREAAVILGRAVLRSRLVASAIHGNDPNVGRIVAAVASQAQQIDIQLSMRRMRLVMGGRVLFEKGAFCLNYQEEQELTRYLKERAFDVTQRGYPPRGDPVEIEIALGAGDKGATVWGGDLTEAYIHENADYRS